MLKNLEPILTLLAHDTGTAHEEPSSLRFFVVIGVAVVVVVVVGWLINRYVDY